MSVNHAVSNSDIRVVMFSHMGRGRGVHRVLVGKRERKKPLGRPRRRWKDNIKMDLQEVGRGCGDWMELAHDRDRWRALVSTVMNLRGHRGCPRQCLPALFLSAL
jgi:hypothetical protein